MLNRDDRKIKKTSSTLRNTRTNSSENKSLLTEGKSQITVNPDGTLEETIRYQGQTYVRSFKRKEGPLAAQHSTSQRFGRPNFDSNWFGFDHNDHNMNSDSAKKVPHGLGKLPLHYEILFAPGQRLLWENKGRVEWYTKINNSIYGYDCSITYEQNVNHNHASSPTTSYGQNLWHEIGGIVSCVDTKAVYIACGTDVGMLGSDFGANNNGNNSTGWSGWNSNSTKAGSITTNQNWEDRPSLYPMNDTTTARGSVYMDGAMRVLLWL